MTTAADGPEPDRPVLDSTPPTFDPRPFLGPRYWLVWTGLGLLWLLVRLPYRVQLGLGAALGMLFYALMPSRRRVGRINLRIAFPDLSEARLRRLLRAHFRSLGIGIFEMGMGWWRDPAWLQSLCRIEGMQHLRAARAAGQGVILMFPHFTTLEVAGLTLASTHPCSALFGESKNRLFRAVLDWRRRRFMQETVPASDVRRCVRLLRDGRVLCYLPDQAARLTRGAVVAAFFGREVLTTPGTARLAALGRARVVPFFPRRLPGGGYRIECQAPLEDFPGDDPVADTRRVNQVFEAQIRQVPEQYLWVHERFKRGPPGTPSPYRKS